MRLLVFCNSPLEFPRLRARFEQPPRSLRRPEDRTCAHVGRALRPRLNLAVGVGAIAPCVHSDLVRSYDATAAVRGVLDAVAMRALDESSCVCIACRHST